MLGELGWIVWPICFRSSSSRFEDYMGICNHWMASNLGCHCHQHHNRQLSSSYRNQMQQCLRPHLQMRLVSCISRGLTVRDRWTDWDGTYFQFDVWEIWVHHDPFRLPIMAYMRHHYWLFRAKYIHVCFFMGKILWKKIFGRDSPLSVFSSVYIFDVRSNRFWKWDSQRSKHQCNQIHVLEWSVSMGRQHSLLVVACPDGTISFDGGKDRDGIKHDSY